MKNRAKCKLCSSLIEIFHSEDYVLCKCGGIGVGGGDAMYTSANDYANFLRIDDEGNEIPVKYQIKNEIDCKASENNTGDDDISGNNPMGKQEFIDMIDMMIKNFGNLPDHAKYAPVTHADLMNFMLLVSMIFKSG